MLRKLVREPLLHFLLLGTLVFVAYRFVPRGADGKSGSIVITQGDIGTMVTGFTRTWHRPPSRQELAGLISDRVREEVYYREALAMGLDRDDAIIRRRLRQKLEFVSDDVAALAEPTDAELAEYLKAHADSFRVERRFTFSQVFLDPERHRERLDRDVARLLVELRRAGRNADLTAVGDPFLLERRLESASTSEIAGQFGDEFAASLGRLPVGQWSGPVESAYGAHLVLVEERSAEHLPALAEVRNAVHREWVNAQRVKANEDLFERLLRRYTVTVASFEATPAGDRLARAE